MIQGRHGIHPKQLQPRHAKMNPPNGVVMQSRRAQRTAIAYAVPENAPGVEQVVAVLPGNLSHLQIVMRLRKAQPKGNPAYRIGFSSTWHRVSGSVVIITLTFRL